MSPRSILNVNFHGIGDPARPLEPGEDKYWITRDVFLSILDSLVGKPNVRISFDDGNESDFLIGLPSLVDRGLTATFFMLAGRLDHRGSLDGGQLSELQANGMRVGTHGMDHRPWPGLPASDLRRELIEAREVLSAATGGVINEAALPLGQYNRHVLQRLKGLGYSRVFSSDWRWAAEGAWLQPRFSVQNGHSADSLWDTVFPHPSLPRRVRQELVGVVKRLR